ncbi:MAG: cupredoxin domain-containing protein, partial [Rhodospirillaceae bacterium]
MKRDCIAKAIYSLALTALVGATPTLALADAAHGHGAAKKIGAPGKAADVTRTIEVTMRDNFYEPENLTIKEGETVRFIVKNAGEFVHEFNIATPDMHKAHAPEMMMMVEHGVLEPDRINWDAAKKMQATMG